MSFLLIPKPRTALAASLGLLFAAPPLWADTPKPEVLEKKQLGGSMIVLGDWLIPREVSLSADGKIAVGTEGNDAKNTRAVVWSGENWTDKTDLGTLKSDHSGVSRARHHLIQETAAAKQIPPKKATAVLS